MLLFSLSVHESAHAWTALQEGDPTAQSRGRISLNPLRHIDPIGTVVLPLLMIFTNVPLLGWAKPTPVDPRYFKDLKRGQIIVSGAGPTSNLMLAVFFTGMLFVALRVVPDPAGNPLFAFLQIGVSLNVLLALFNMVPLPPLDGSHIVQWVLPNGLGHRYIRAIAPYGGFILLALVMTGALWVVIGPIYEAIVDALVTVALP